MKRRDFLKLGMLSTAAPFALSSSRLWARSAASPPNAPHFFIQVYVPAGWDSMYLWDSRPLEMTQKNLVQNYLGQEAISWSGNNGSQTWASPIVRPLLKHQNEMTIVNGVLMSTTFDGHEQNREFFITGNPFGGEHFGAHLSAKQPRPLDLVRVNSKGPAQGGQIVSVSANSGFQLAQLAQGAKPHHQKVTQYLVERATQLKSSNNGVYSAGMNQLIAALQGSKTVRDGFSEVTNPAQGSLDRDEVSKSMHFISETFRHGVCRSATLWLDHPFDTHAPDQARQQVPLYRKLVDQLDTLITHLKETPSADGQSLLNHTTVCITSEFSRTMKHPNIPVDNTGTNHNTLNNTFVFLGKGIQSGKIIGESDWRTPQERLSGAHIQMDRAKLKFMGRPYDFKNKKVETGADPEEFVRSQYLTSESVVNSLYALMGVDQEKYRKIDEKPAPVIQDLIQS